LVDLFELLLLNVLKSVVLGLLLNFHQSPITFSIKLPTHI